MRVLVYMLSCCSLLLFSCEKTIDITLDDTEPKLVVEAVIENDMYPTVILSRSLGFFEQLDPGTISQSFVRQADVSVSDGNMEQKLKEYSRELAPGLFFHYYTVDSANLQDAFKGVPGTNYQLTINVEGKQYQASTIIKPRLPQIDTMYAKPVPGNADTSLARLFIRSTDAPGFGDYIRYFTSRNSEPFYPGLNSVFDDQVIDGTSSEIEVERGWNRNIEREEDDVFFRKGDTVTIKLCHIDKATFDFWRTMEFSYASIGNPFSSPPNILSNISPDALGYFGGYACVYKSIIIPQ